MDPRLAMRVLAADGLNLFLCLPQAASPRGTAFVILRPYCPVYYVGDVYSDVWGTLCVNEIAPSYPSSPAGNRFRASIVAKRNKFRMAQPIVGRPFEEFDRSDELRLQPTAFLHVFGG